MKNRILTLGCFGLAMSLQACATQPTPIYAEPVFNKYGNPDCRPGNVPIGGAYTADLPTCVTIAGVSTPVVDTNNDGVADSDAGTSIDAILDPVDPPLPVDPPIDDTNGQNRYGQQGNGQQGSGGTN